MLTPTIVHFKKAPYDVYIARPSKWGNPYSRKPGIAKFKVTTTAEAIRLHREWVLNQPDYVEEIKKHLRGKVLGCWCDNPYTCHGYILWQIANDIVIETKNDSNDQPTLF
tara:strand:+ start:315 stop:644 length:330 start_codon:yes stop_codon:yes gene_type:complete